MAIRFDPKKIQAKLAEDTAAKAAETPAEKKDKRSLAEEVVPEGPVGEPKYAAPAAAPKPQEDQATLAVLSDALRGATALQKIQVEKITALEAQVAKLTEERDAAVKRAETAEAGASATGAKEAELVSLREQLGKKDEKLAELQRTTDLVVRKNEGLTRAKDDAEGKVKDAEALVTKLAGERDAALGSASTLATERDAAVTRAEAAETRAAEAEAAAAAKPAVVPGTDAEKDERILTLEAQVADVREASRTLVEEYEGELAHKSERITALEGEVAAALERAESAERCVVAGSDSAEKDATISRLEAQVSEVRDTSNALITDLEREVGEKRAALEQKDAALDAKDAALAQRDERIAALGRELAEKDNPAVQTVTAYTLVMEALAAGKWTPVTEQLTPGVIYSTLQGVAATDGEPLAKKANAVLGTATMLDQILVASGLLHDGQLQSVRDILKSVDEANAFERLKAAGRALCNQKNAILADKAKEVFEGAD